MLSNKRLVAYCTLALICNITLLLFFLKYQAGEKCYVTLNVHQNIVYVLPDDFLSIGIDTSEIADYGKIDFTNERLRDMAASLAPAKLRLGGTMSERLIFSPEPANVSCSWSCHKNTHPKHLCSYIRKLCQHKDLPFFILTGQKWTDINKFCEATNLKLLFTFNVLLRDGDDWSALNAKELLDYSMKQDFNVDWQLGNEPNSFRHVFNESISPESLAHGFEKLRKLLGTYTAYNSSLLVGPDTTRPQPSHPECLQYMIDFLEKGSQYINARSWHQYYLNSRTATLEDFWNPSTLDLLKDQIEIMKTHTAKYNDIPMWLTETSSSYGGGAPGLSNSYAGSPLWIDKLGLAAKNNITTVVRQSFVGKYYSLISDELEPLPDWWLSLLYKKLVGNKVLHINCNCSNFQRIYAHCANSKYANDASAVTIYGINLEMSTVHFKLKGTAFHANQLSIDEYIVRAPSNNRKSKIVLLNGWPLYYEHPLPNLEPQHKHGNDISMPPYSIGFWVVKNTSIKICL